jgi:hypothetical protein
MAAGAVVTTGVVMTTGAGGLAGAGPETLSGGIDDEAAGRRDAGANRGTATLSDNTGINDSGVTDTTGTS